MTGKSKLQAGKSAQMGRKAAAIRMEFGRDRQIVATWALSKRKSHPAEGIVGLKDDLRRMDALDRPGSFEVFYDAHAPGLFGFVRSYLGSPEEAEDAVHDVFVSILKKERWRRAENPSAYLYKAVRNEALSRLRKRAVRERATKALIQGAPLVEAVDSGTVQEDAVEVNRALGALPTEQREVVVLKVYRGMTYREIGQITGVSANTAASRYRYAITKLQSLLESTQGKADGSDRTNA